MGVFSNKHCIYKVLVLFFISRCWKRRTISRIKRVETIEINRQVIESTGKEKSIGVCNNDGMKMEILRKTIQTLLKGLPQSAPRLKMKTSALMAAFPSLWKRQSEKNNSQRSLSNPQYVPF